MFAWLEQINHILWSGPVFILLVGMGIYLSVHTGFVQIRWLPKAISCLYRSIRKKDNGNDNRSGYRALCTALAATVGTGNLAGVAGAIALGGPGVVFWMWVCGCLGMVLKFAEIVLAMHYRQRTSSGEWLGGPMYMIQNGMPKKFHYLATIYCFFGVVASFGIGNTTQVNTVIDSIHSICGDAVGNQDLYINLLLGILVSVLVGFSFLKGAGKIGEITEKLVPFAAVFYILLAAGVLIMKFDSIPDAFRSILLGAFQPQAATGGVILSVIQTMRVGAARGIFTNEAGMGTASIAHASAKTDPIHQGMLGIVEVFMDTIVICTLTAFVILVSDIPISYGKDTGIQLTMNAFSGVYGNWIQIPVTIAVCLFAFATILGWGLYGARCAQFLFGQRVWKVYSYCQIGMVILGAVGNTSALWLMSEFVNALMVIPNMIAVIWLSPVFIRGIKANRYWDKDISTNGNLDNSYG